MASRPLQAQSRRSLLKRLSISFASLFFAKYLPASEKEKQIDSTCNTNCPGQEECQGFVPPCSNCNDPKRWKSRAQNRLEHSFRNFWTIPRW